MLKVGSRVKIFGSVLKFFKSRRVYRVSAIRKYLLDDVYYFCEGDSKKYSFKYNARLINAWVKSKSSDEENKIVVLD